MLRGIPYLNVEYNSHMNVTDPDTAAHITQVR